MLHLGIGWLRSLLQLPDPGSSRAAPDDFLTASRAVADIRPALCPGSFLPLQLLPAFECPKVGEAR